MIPIAAGLLTIGQSLIDKLIPDPEAKAKAQLELLKLQQEGQLKELETRMSAILAEAQSSDKWTSRARPAFMYVFYTIVLSLVLLAPAVGVFFPAVMDKFYVNVGNGFSKIPGEFWETFFIGYVGYAATRSYEKAKGVSK